MPTLYPDQVTGAAWLRERGRTALLADEYGFGKTAIECSSIDSGRPWLFVAPACIRYKIADEIAMWRPGEWVPHFVESMGDFRWPRLREVVIVNRELLSSTKGEVVRAKREVKEAAKRPANELDFAKIERGATAGKRLARAEKMMGAIDTPPPDGMHLSIDESHVYSGTNKLTDRMRMVVRATLKVGGTVHGMTATPALNDPGELLKMLTTLQLHKESFPGGWYEYLRVAGGLQGRFGILWGEPNDEKLAAHLRPVMLRRLLRDWREMPRLLPALTIAAEPDAAFRELAERGELELARRGVDLWAYLQEEGQRPKGGRETSAIAFEWLSRLGVALDVAKIPATEKYVADLERAGEPVLLGSSYAESVRHFGRRDGWASITGAESPRKRHEIMTDFARGKYRGVAGTIRSMGVGGDWTRAAHAVCTTIDWVPAWTNQWFARTYRTGQTRDVQPARVSTPHVLDGRRIAVEGRKLRFYEAIDAAAVRPEVAPC